jgi:hypothetical protein
MHAAEARPIIIRQGDVLLQPIPRVAKAFEAAPVDRDGSATLAHGEATGHRHRFERAALDDGSALSAIFVHPVARAEVSHVILKEPQHLLHEEHSPHEIAPGSWRVSRPYEYAGTDLPRMVED